MNVAIFGGFGKRPLAPGWNKETAIALFGGGDFDLRAAEPVDGARLNAFAMFGGIDVVVAPGTRVTMSGFSLLAGREADVTPGAGPALHVRAIAILGSVDIKEKPLDDHD